MKIVRINLHEVMNFANICEERLSLPRQTPVSRDLTDSCEYPELYLQYEQDEAGILGNEARLYIGDGAGCGPETAASDVCVLSRDGSMRIERR